MHENFRALIAPGLAHVGDARAVGGPARLGLVEFGAAQLAMRAVLGVEQPQIAAAPIAHDIEAAAPIDDGAAIRRNLRVQRPFQFKHIQGSERRQPIRAGVVIGRGQRRDQAQGQDQARGDGDGERHDKSLQRGEGRA